MNSTSPANYFFPQGTPFSDKSLGLIYQNSNASVRGCTLSRYIYKDRVNLSWGYLGVYAHLRLQKSANSSFKLFQTHSYLLDHGFAPSTLKGKVFRLARMNYFLNSTIFSKPLLSTEDIDIIYNYLKRISGSQDVKVSVPAFYNKFKPSSSSTKTLLIKSSSVLKRLNLEEEKLTHSWLKRYNSFFNGSEVNYIYPLISIKKLDASLTPKGKTKFKNILCTDLSLKYEEISEVCCPTSMFAISFILNSVPVYLSKIHPLYPLLGSYVPSMHQKDALELIMGVLLQTCVSISRFQDLELYLADKSKFEA